MDHNGQHGILVDGEWRRLDRVFENRNPAAPRELVGLFSSAGPDEVGEAYAAARAAAKGWARTSAIERGNLLYRVSELLAARADELARELAREEGKVLAEARGEVLRGVAILRFFAGEAAQPIGNVHPAASAETFLYSVREPLGVVCLVTPWNFPVAIPLWKLSPALAFGNAIVWKPSVLTPLTAVRIAEVFQEAGLPPGVLNLVTGSREDVGDSVTSDPEIDGISFTGSATAGRALHVRAVELGAKVQLELGGKNPVIVLDDADMALAVRRTIEGAMLSTGQKCTATGRAIVMRSVADEFTERVLAEARALRVGDPLTEGVQIGPLASEGQFRHVVDYLDVAASEGHEVGCGGRPQGDPEDGYFVAPTVLLDVETRSRVGQEEIFGPVLAIMPSDDLEQALAVANDVEYGLSASVFTRDLGRAFRFAREIEAGVVHVNSESTGAEPQVPFGGMKGSSSHSREQGKAAAEFYTDVKTVYVEMPPSL